MDWFALGALVPIGVLFHQGVTCLRRSAKGSWLERFGWLAILLGALGAMQWWLLLFGGVVVSPELALIMVQGGPSVVGVYGFMGGLVLSAGLAWSTVRLAHSFTGRPWLVVTAVAALAAVGLRPLVVLNPRDAPALQVSVYDLLWPPLIFWLVFCSVDAVVMAAGLTGRLVRRWATLTLLSAAALLVQGHPRIEELSRQAEWSGWSAGFGFGAVAVLFLAVCARLGATVTSTSVLAVSFSGALGIGLVLCAMLAWAPELRWGVVILVAGVGLALFGGRAVAAWRPSVLFSRATWRRGMTVVGSAVVLVTVADFMFVSLMNPWLALVAFALAWITIAEVNAGGPIATLIKITIRRGLPGLWPHLRQLLPGRGAAPAASPTATAAGPSSAWTVSALIARVLLVLALLIVINDLPNMRTTLIDSFTAGTTNRQDLAELLRDALNRLDRELRPDIIALEPPGLTGTTYRVVTGGGTGSLDAALAKSGDVEVSGYKLPLDFFANLIRRPIRWALRVEVISGSLQVEGNRSALIAFSSLGESWNVPVAKDLAGATDELAFHVMTGARRRFPGMTEVWPAYRKYREGLQDYQRWEHTRDPVELRGAIGKFLEASRSDPSFALARYRLGLALQEIGELSAAAEAFRASTRASRDLIEGSLALATVLQHHERLRSRGGRSILHAGLAGGDDRAIDTVGVTGLDHLAPMTAMVDSREAGLPPLRRVVPRPDSLEFLRAIFREADATLREREPARRDESRSILLDVVRSPDVPSSQRAVAYYGLCRHALEADGFGVDRDDSARALAYYLCSRSLDLYEPLVRTAANRDRVIGGRAAVLDAMGDVLSRRPRVAWPVNTADWHCTPSPRKSPYSVAAFAYYAEAETLMPASRVIRCNAATTALVIGNSTKMRALARSSSAHLAVAEDYLIERKYLSALDEYSQAVALDPDRSEALVGYAETFWRRRLHAPAIYESVLAERAERYAAQAVRIGASRLTVTDTRIAQGVLGKVLLAQARVVEAIDTLQRALMPSGAPFDDKAPVSPVFDEIRWALAQAHLCAAASGLRGDESRRAAVSLLERIRENETLYERPAFAGRSYLLDPSRPLSLCLLKEINAWSIEPPRFELAGNGGMSYSAHTVCEWMGVRAVLSETPEASRRYRLRVWGRGLNERVALADSPVTVMLGVKPRATEGEYFAQLEAREGGAVSRIVSLRSKGGCHENLTTLVFVLRPM